MGTILGKGFAQAQVHTNNSMSAEGTSAMMYARVLVQNPFPKSVPIAKLHSLIVTLVKKICDKNLSNCIIHIYIYP